MIRDVFWTKEFSVFFNELPERVQEKFYYVISVVKIEYPIPAKFVKHIDGTDFYEMRVSIGGNGYRTIYSLWITQMQYLQRRLCCLTHS